VQHEDAITFPSAGAMKAFSAAAAAATSVYNQRAVIGVAANEFANATTQP
jgi:hypothetical protein